MDLLLDRDGTLWIATANGVVFLQQNRLTELSGEAFSRVRCRTLLQGVDGRLWIGTDQGLYCRQGAKFVRIAGDVLTGVINHLTLRGEEVWIAADAGLFCSLADGSVQKVALPPVSTDSIRSVAAQSGQIWVGTAGEGLWLLDKSQWIPGASLGCPARAIYRIQTTPSGILAVATGDAGLFLKRSAAASFEHWDRAKGLPSHIVNCVFEDREQNLWIGTDIGGVARLGTNSVANYGMQQGLPHACVFGISPGAGEDSLWLGTLRGAVHLQVRPQVKVLETIGKTEGLIHEQVWKVRQGKDGTLWLLSEIDFRYRLPGQSKLTPVPDAPPVAGDGPWDFLLDEQDRVWLVGKSSEGGIAMRDSAGSWKSWHRSEEGTPLLFCTAIHKRQKGGMWIAAENRLFVHDGERIRLLDRQPDLPQGGHISCILEDRQGRLWIGNDANLAILNPEGSWKRLNEVEAFTNHHVYFIKEDSAGIVWVGTARGVFLFRNDSECESFTPEDGLADYETNNHGFYSDGYGNRWIGTVNGLTCYSGRPLHDNPIPPKLSIERAETPNRVVEFPARLDLEWRERTVTFHIAWLSFRGRQRSGYRARMENQEESWLPLRREAELRYTNLPPGEHRLLVQAVNEAGRWGDVVALPVKVTPPFWWNRSYQVAGAILLALMVGLGIRRRTQLLQRRNLELERVVSERTADLTKANRQLTEMATTDALTGLWNRRFILDSLDRMIRGRRPFALILIDVDNFKWVNDRLGHTIGDDILRSVTQHLRGVLRIGDLVGRYGGDEFLVLLPTAEKEILESIGARLGKISLEARSDQESVAVTLSCGGILIADRIEVDQKELLTRADELLYQVKHEGKHGFSCLVLQSGNSNRDRSTPVG